MVRHMEYRRPEVAAGRVRLATRLPERVIGELDMEIGRQRMDGNWLTRSDAVNQALSAFFAETTLGTVGTDVVEAALAGPRRSLSTHLDYELAVQINVEKDSELAVGVAWGVWEVVAVAVRYFLDNGGFTKRAPVSGE